MKKLEVNKARAHSANGLISKKLYFSVISEKPERCINARLQVVDNELLVYYFGRHRDNLKAIFDVL